MEFIIAVLISASMLLQSAAVSTRISLENFPEPGLLTTEQKRPPLATFELKEFMSNTADEDTTHFVRIKMSIGYEKTNLLLQTELSDRRVQIFDLILLTLNGKRKIDLDSTQKKQDLKVELMIKINALLQTGKIDDIYYAEFSVN